VPLSRYFPEYSGGTDVTKAAKYVLWRFTQTNRVSKNKDCGMPSFCAADNACDTQARLSIYPHLTQATDTNNIRLVFAAVKE
jgi:guanine nucleotide-binding protein G(i) subunit alpha